MKMRGILSTLFAAVTLLVLTGCPSDFQGDWRGQFFGLTDENGVHHEEIPVPLADGGTLVFDNGQYIWSLDPREDGLYLQVRQGGLRETIYLGSVPAFRQALSTQDTPMRGELLASENNLGYDLRFYIELVGDPARPDYQLTFLFFSPGGQWPIGSFVARKRR